MASYLLANANDLHQWADTTLEAQSIFPELIRRLVHATGKRITHSSFPAGKSVLLPGWDGTLVCGEPAAYTPAGASGWEFGTSSGVKGKADEDYENRKADPAGLTPAETAFIFATPRIWSKRDDWAVARTAEKVWREVRAYDARSLEEWLQLAPAVHVWISRIVGKRPEGATDLETYWLDWSRATNPPLPHSLLLASRSGAADQVKVWISSAGPQPLVLQADTRDEAAAFFAAVAESLPEDQRAAILARSVVVEDKDAWDALVSPQASLVLIPLFDGAEAVAKAVLSGHSVFLPKGRGDTAGKDPVILKPIRRQDATEALVAIGLERERAVQLAAHAKTGLAALRRQLSHAPDPTWANADDAQFLVPAMLAGAWSDTSAADRAVLEKLGAQDYGQLSVGFVRLANQSDPSLRHSGDSWSITNKADAWRLLARFLVREQLHSFLEVAVDVLGAADPKFELPDDEQWLASLHGKLPPQSKRLREGLADTAAMLGAHGATVVGADTTQDYAEALVRRVLERANKDWRVWASLSSLLPLLAEAAPDVFISGLEVAVAGQKPLIAELFRDEKNDGWFTSSPHTGLLFALEMLARSSQHVGGAALLLARLAALDPGGRLGNRPAESLREIFLPWFPQTAASLERRLAILDNMRTRYPEVAWELMVKLLPRSSDHAGHTPAPKWREWSIPERREINRVEYAREIQGITNRLIADVGKRGTRWWSLIAALDDVPPAEHHAIVAALAALDVDSLEADDRAKIADALRELVSRHRSFQDAEWALPPEVVDRLASLHHKFESPDVALRFAYLFGDSPQLLEGRERNFEEHQKELEAARSSAAASLYDAKGIAGVLELATAVKRPDVLGITVGMRGLGSAEEDEILERFLAGDDAAARFTRGYCVGRTCAAGRKWTEEKLRSVSSRWSPTHRGWLLLSLPLDDETWALAEAEGADTERAYWQAAFPWSVKLEAVPRAVRKLVQYGRPFMAVHLLGLHHATKDPLPSEVVAEALEAAMKSDPSGERPDSNFGYHAAELLTWLAAQGFDETRLATLEWNFLPLFRSGHGEPLVLHKALGKSPQFFVEVVSAAYRAEGEEPRELDEAGKQRARYAYELLDEWRTVPGTTESGNITAEVLQTWVTDARRIAAEHLRGKIADYVIGEVLSGSPMGQDGAWPHEAVRDVVEQVGSSDLDRGIGIGKRNSRGPVWRQPGGAQEEELARQYDGYADKCADRWPRTAALLRGIARQYRGEARWHDLDDELE